jgi:hypothetical protein
MTSVSDEAALNYGGLDRSGRCARQKHGACRRITNDGKSAGKVEHMLSSIETVLRPFVSAAGLARTDLAIDNDVSWVEYRAANAAVPYILGIYHSRPQRVITAEAWRPEALSQAVRAGMPERVADARRVWNYTDSVDLGDLEKEIADTVLFWVASGMPRAS